MTGTIKEQPGESVSRMHALLPGALQEIDRELQNAEIKSGPIIVRGKTVGINSGSTREKILSREAHTITVRSVVIPAWHNPVESHYESGRSYCEITEAVSDTGYQIRDGEVWVFSVSDENIPPRLIDEVITENGDASASHIIELLLALQESADIDEADVEEVVQSTRYDVSSAGM